MSDLTKSVWGSWHSLLSFLIIESFRENKRILNPVMALFLWRSTTQWSNESKDTRKYLPGMQNKLWQQSTTDCTHQVSIRQLSQPLHASSWSTTGRANTNAQRQRSRREQKKKETRTSAKSSNDTGNKTRQLHKTTSNSIRPPHPTSNTNARTSTRKNTTTTQAPTSAAHPPGIPDKKVHQRPTTIPSIRQKTTASKHHQP